LKDEVLDRMLYRIRFGRGYKAVANGLRNQSIYEYFLGIWCNFHLPIYIWR